MYTCIAYQKCVHIASTYYMYINMRFHVDRCIYMYILFTENGFCSSEIINTTHGKYMWNETTAGETDEQTCLFGTKDGLEGGKAKRFCMLHDMWDVYDGSACVTEVTYRIQKIAEVHTSTGKREDYLSPISGTYKYFT